MYIFFSKLSLRGVLLLRNVRNLKGRPLQSRRLIKNYTKNEWSAILKKIERNSKNVDVSERNLTVISREDLIHHKMDFENIAKVKLIVNIAFSFSFSIFLSLKDSEKN